MANKLPNATAGMTFPRPKPDTPPSMVKKIGKTTYLVWAHFTIMMVCSVRKSAK